MTDAKDCLFRISLKCYIENNEGEVLLVKEGKRDWWDLPGGGLDFGETIHDAIRRELFEEVAYTGDFEYKPIIIEEPRLIGRDGVVQVRILLQVLPSGFSFALGNHASKICWSNPSSFKGSAEYAEQQVYACWRQLHTQDD